MPHEAGGMLSWQNAQLEASSDPFTPAPSPSQGIFYNCYEPPAKDGVDLGTETDINLNQQLRYHVLGSPQREDPVVYAIPEFPDHMIGAQTTDDGRQGSPAAGAAILHPRNGRINTQQISRCTCMDPVAYSACLAIMTTGWVRYISLLASSS